MVKFFHYILRYINNTSLFTTVEQQQHAPDNIAPYKNYKLINL